MDEELSQFSFILEMIMREVANVDDEGNLILDGDSIERVADQFYTHLKEHPLL